jgi:peroxiredoxin (alkyl hydroperoxide reductase subunit C)
MWHAKCSSSFIGSLRETDMDLNEDIVPEIEQAAPQFIAPSTHGDLHLQNYKGSWIVLFSYVSDFSPVCASEVVAFAKKYSEFRTANTQILGLSVDSPSSHLAWIQELQKDFGVTIEYPLIADIKREVIAKYGMLHEGSSTLSTIRSVFIIDTQQVLRASLHYPPSVGRSVNEIYRIVGALQLHDKNSTVTPEGWQPGERTLKPPPQTIKDLEEKGIRQSDKSDWYFSFESSQSK